MKTLGLSALSIMALFSSQAHAGALAIPEPGVISLIAGGAIAGLIAYRLRKRK